MDDGWDLNIPSQPKAMTPAIAPSSAADLQPQTSEARRSPQRMIDALNVPVH